MGVLNVTPDSFSDGGHYLSMGQAIKQAINLVADGADIID
ncbi:MAG: dihydropteroate synthase, partial [Deltaproteobacteria bacterium]|nr:dihydropteroate synthase [Deltaproteobacteria bacterium]